MNIDIRNLCKSYYLNSKEISVLTDINFDIKNGDLISLTGTSGVGKSTLLHLLGTLDLPSKGFIVYDKQNLAAMSDTKIAQFRNEKIGFVFQFHHLMSEFSALENVCMPLLMRRIKREKALTRAAEVLSYVGLSHRLLHKPGELSGGEQQRVALARALVHEPKLLLADEPTGNLDEKTGFEIVSFIKKYHKESNATVVLVTHNKAISESFPIQLMLSKNGISII